MVEVVKQGFLGNEKFINRELCDHVILGKQQKVNFKNGDHNDSEPFEYIYSDLCDPTRVATHKVVSISSLLLIISLEGYESTYWKIKVTPIKSSKNFILLEEISWELNLMDCKLIIFRSLFPRNLMSFIGNTVL